MDTAENMTLKGNFGLYYSEHEYAMVTDSALMIQVDGPDTMYVHADTLRSMQNTDSAGSWPDSEGLLQGENLPAATSR